MKAFLFLSSLEDLCEKKKIKHRICYSSMPLTCELGNISPVTEHYVCKLCIHRRHPHYHFGNITTNKSSNQKYFGIQLFELYRIHISNIVFGFISTLMTFVTCHKPRALTAGLTRTDAFLSCTFTVRSNVAIATRSPLDDVMIR